MKWKSYLASVRVTVGKKAVSLGWVYGDSLVSEKEDRF